MNQTKLEQHLCLSSPSVIFTAMTEEMDGILLFYHLLIINIISSGSADRIKKLNGPHVALGP